MRKLVQKSLGISAESLQSRNLGAGAAAELASSYRRLLLPATTTCYLLLTTYYLLPTTHYLLPTTYYLCTNCLLLTFYRLLLTAYCLLLTIYYLDSKSTPGHRRLTQRVTLLTGIANYGKKLRVSCARQSWQQEASPRGGVVPFQGAGRSAHELGSSVRLPAIIASGTLIPLRLELPAEEVTSSRAGYTKV